MPSTFNAHKRDLFHTLFDNAAASMAIVLTDGTMVMFNRAFCELVGYSEAELLQLKVFDITLPEDMELTAAQFRNGSEGKGTAFQYEKRYLRKDGLIVWGLVSGSWVVDEGIAYGVALIQDITARKESEIALRESEELYRTLVENIDLGIILIGEDRRVVKANTAVGKLFSKPSESFAGLECFREFEKRDKICEHCPGTESMATGKPAMVITEGVRDDGTRAVVRLHTFPVRDADGKVRKFVEIVEDITERMEVRDALRESENRFRGIFEHAAAGIYTISPQTEFLRVNRALCLFLGYTEEELLGMTIDGVTHTEDLELTRRMIGNAMSESPFKWHYEKRYRHKDGSVLWAHVSGAWQLDETGLPVHGIGLVQDITERKRSEETLRHLANYDALTDLPNRQLLESILLHALERARREKQRLALLVMDLDQFKAINESFGHKIGDDLLVAVVERLRSRVRGEDTLSRLEGDRFALVLNEIQDYSDVEVVAHDLQAVLEEPFTLQDGQQVYLRASLGISIFPQDGGSPQDLLRGTEVAVHLAKDRGGNQFCYCTSELNAQARTRMELQAAMQQALEREEFIQYYQPIVDLRSGRIVSAEALLRWNSPDRGMIQPLQFIPIAEKNGFIVPLGAWVIDDVCRQIRQWHDEGLENVCVSVNVSARQFRTGNLEDLVSASLQRHGLDPKCLMLELTESMLMDDPEEAIDRIAGLRRIGVRISLDDFGTGYSSLGYLGRFPIDQLKIDQSFIKDIVTDPNSATISTSVIALAHRMRLNVVAEGVETEAQLGYLRQNDCDKIQGFYFSKPVPAEEFAQLLREGKTLPPAQDTSALPTLLIVDDEPHILYAVRRLLMDEGYRVLTASTALEGLELLARNAVQVVITDQRMPEMSGTEFLRRVKALHPNTVRLVLTGYADLPTVTEAVNEGALYKFLVKPWDDDDLCEQIRDAFFFYEAHIKPRGVLSEGFG